MHILMILYMVLSYLMLFDALSFCWYDVSFFAIDFLVNAFCFHALFWSIDTQFLHFIYLVASCTVHLICWFVLIPCSHRFS